MRIGRARSTEGRAGLAKREESVGALCRALGVASRLLCLTPFFGWAMYCTSIVPFCFSRNLVVRSDDTIAHALTWA